jgi:hypothetical protein
MLEQIRLLLKSAPFSPFAINCSGGDVFRVEHPENAAIVGHWVVVAMPDGENAVMLSPLHIVGISGADNFAAQV